MISGTIQTSNKRNLIYLQYSTTSNASYKTNDNTYTNLNWNYRVTKKHDYTFGVFKQKYRLVPTNVLDTSSDNIGAKVIGTWNKNFSKNQSGYLNLGFTYTDYNQDATRKDQLYDINSGLQTYLGRDASLTPSFSLNYLKSKNSYYQYLSLGPGLNFYLYLNDKLSLFISGSYLYTAYGKRTFSLTSITGKVITTSEKQTLVIADIGTTFYITKNVPLHVTYSNTKNSSNYSYRDYKISNLSASIGINF